MNKWTRAAIPALLIHCSIGTVYCWSTFKQSIAEAIGMTPFAVGNPCRVLREITEEDRHYYFRDRKFDVDDYM